jgi:hypothetical protein
MGLLNGVLGRAGGIAALHCDEHLFWHMHGGIPKDWDGMNLQIEIEDEAFIMTRIFRILAFGEDE